MRFAGLRREQTFRRQTYSRSGSAAGDALSLDELAQYAGVGRTRFAESFAQRFGCSPHRYVVRRRIERAKVLLREGRRSMTAIAYEPGFSSPSHFSAAFKASTRISPQVYAEAQNALLSS